MAFCFFAKQRRAWLSLLADFFEQDFSFFAKPAHFSAIFQKNKIRFAMSSALSYCLPHHKSDVYRTRTKDASTGSHMTPLSRVYATKNKMFAILIHIYEITN